MKFVDIKDMAVKELNKKRIELRETLLISKMKNSLGQLANPLEIRHTRKTLAKIETAIKQKQTAQKA